MFLFVRDVIRTPALISTGTVEVEQFSSEVIPSTDLKAIIDAINTNDVPLIGRQLRTFGGGIAGSNFIYTITDYNSDGDGLITIDPLYMDSSNSTATFQIFKNIYSPPSFIQRDTEDNILFEGIDFDSFDFVAAPFDRRRLGLELSHTDIERKDPSRTAMGDPRYLASYGENLFEMYPIPTQARVYPVRYKRQGRLLEPEEDIPSQLPYELITAKAKAKIYEWMVENGEKVGDKKSPNVWMNMIAMVSNPNMEGSYEKLLAQAKLRDENLFPQALIDMGSWPYYEDVIVETVLLDF